nr:retrotransposon protein, putative, Ty1-copia subclass [Tanacetum cinerariifolium]
MTTSSTNNSVFRGFFEKQKPTGPNFIDWYRQLMIVLSIEDKLNYLEQPIPLAPVAPAGQQVALEILTAHSVWVKGSKEINYNMHSMEKTINELHAMLKLHEQTLPKRNALALNAIRAGKGKNKQAYAPKPKIPPPPKRENPAMDSICHECREIGHWKRNCPQYLAELMKKKMNTTSRAGGSGIFVIELNTILNRSWIYDIGCGTHICNTTQGRRASRKLKPGALSLYVGNGQREAVEVNGAFYLCLPSGLKIVLNICHYAPFITRGVISVSRLYDDGFVNCFVDNTIQVSRNNMVYFCAIPRDGIFEIDLSNSLTNESSVYAVSNKRAFEKCVSCMSEKMARKPYTHQVERAKDLLGLIHTDGCEALVKRDTLTKLNKLESRSVECIFIGYPKETMGYSFYYPHKNKVLVARNAKFLKNSLIDQEASGSLEDLEIIREEDTHLSLDTSLNHEEDNLEIDEPQSDIVPIRRSIRTRHAPDRMCLYIDAEEHELGDLDNEVWFLVELPPNGKTIGSKWLFKKKTDIDGNVHIYKARLVAKGYTQTSRIDYEETFSPFADIRAIRILITIAAYYDYEICIQMLQSVKTYLGKCFAMKDLGEVACILGIKIYEDISKRLINLCQSAYIEKILKRYCIKNSKRGSIPMQEKLKLSKSQGASTPAEMKRMQNVLYALAVGFIMYAVRCTRPDVAFAQNITSRFQQNPSDIHRTTVKNILKYFRNTKDMFLVYGGDLKRELKVSCYTDAGYLTDADDLKSQTGYVFVLNGGAVDWKSAKQSIFATSSAEAEYITAFDASKEAVWVRKFIFGLSVIPTIEEPISML